MNSEKKNNKNNNKATLNKFNNLIIPGMGVLQDVVASDFLAGDVQILFYAIYNYKYLEDKNSGVNLYTYNNNITTTNVCNDNNNVDVESRDSNKSTTPELETIRNRVKELVREQNTFEKDWIA